MTPNIAREIIDDINEGGMIESDTYNHLLDFISSAPPSTERYLLEKVQEDISLGGMIESDTYDHLLDSLTN